MAKEKEYNATTKSAAPREKKTKKKDSVLSVSAGSGASNIETVVKKQPKATRARMKTPKSKSAPARAAKPTLSDVQEAIRLRAYEIYLQRAGQPGNPHEDWAVAEREIRLYLVQNTDAQA
jgi:hypothetical protein